MNKQKCAHCQLVNLPQDLECRRCGRILGMKTSVPTVNEAQKKGFSMFPVVVVMIIIGIGAFIVWGVQRSYYQAAADDANRAAHTRGTQAFQAGPGGGDQPQPIPMANIQVPQIKPIPSIDMSKIKIPAGPYPPSAPAPRPQAPEPPKENPNAAKVRAIENGLSKP